MRKELDEKRMRHPFLLEKLSWLSCAKAWGIFPNIWMSEVGNDYQSSFHISIVSTVAEQEDLSAEELDRASHQDHSEGVKLDKVLRLRAQTKGKGRVGAKTRSSLGTGRRNGVRRVWNWGLLSHKGLNPWANARRGGLFFLGKSRLSFYWYFPLIMNKRKNCLKHKGYFRNLRNPLACNRIS